MNVKDLIAKYNADEVAGRLMVRIGGRNEFMATYDSNGFQLTEVGKQLEAGKLRADGQVDTSPPPPAPKAHVGRKKKDDVSDLTLGLDD